MSTHQSKPPTTREEWEGVTRDPTDADLGYPQNGSLRSFALGDDEVVFYSQGEVGDVWLQGEPITLGTEGERP